MRKAGTEETRYKIQTNPNNKIKIFNIDIWVLFGIFQKLLIDMQAKIFNLESRTLWFAKAVVETTSALPKSLANIEFTKQLLRSSASIGANYIEANDALGKKDFTLRIKIARKEAKETKYWLQLITPKEIDQSNVAALIKESDELIAILSAIIKKVQN